MYVFDRGYGIGDWFRKLSWNGCHFWEFFHVSHDRKSIIILKYVRFWVLLHSNFLLLFITKMQKLLIKHKNPIIMGLPFLVMRTNKKRSKE